MVTVANPDGYYWNERNRPNGGGMKRKNGRPCCTRKGADDGVRSAAAQSSRHRRSKPPGENDGVRLPRARRADRRRRRPAPLAAPPAARRAPPTARRPRPPTRRRPLQVDLNRNFGFKWGYNNEDSSPYGCAEEYRGKEAFSEPETRGLRDLVHLHRPKAILPARLVRRRRPPPARRPLPPAHPSADLHHLFHHLRGNDIAYPFSYAWNAKLKPDELGLFQEIAAEMAQTNHYSYGRAWESVGYTTNGEADDWGWASEGIPSWTVEVGTSKDSFWPAPSRIGTIAQENVWAARTLAWAAGPQLQLDSVSVRPADASGKNVEVSLVWQNNGLEDFSAGHTICVPAVGGGMKAKASAGWTLPPAKDKLCHSLQALPKRTSHALPPLTVTVDGASTSHLEFVFAVELRRRPSSPGRWSSASATRRARTRNATTLSWTRRWRWSTRTSAARACRRAPTAARRKAHTGSNWASGAPPPPNPPPRAASPPAASSAQA